MSVAGFDTTLVIAFRVSWTPFPGGFVWVTEAAYIGPGNIT